MNRKGTWIVAAISFCALVAGIACAIGMRVQPGGALVQGWPVGEKRELPTPLVIFNDDAVKRTMTLAALKPSAIGAAPIRGYAELPDPAWFSFHPAVVEVPPKSHAAVRMFLTVPDNPEYLNQNWSLNLAVRSRHAVPQQIGIAVYPRFEIETRASPADTRPHGSLAITPSLVIFDSLRPGAKPRTLALRLWNNTAADKTLILSIHGRPQKDKRPVVTLSGGQSWIPDTAWIKPDHSEITLKPGQSADLNLRCAVPASPMHNGGAWEAILLAEEQAKLAVFARIRLTTVASNAVDPTGD